MDFQVQRIREARERYGDQPRNPLGIIHPDRRAGRIFAGGGDATPDWETFNPDVKLNF